MYRFLIIIFLILGGNLKLFSIENHSAGARSLALSHAFVSLSDTWSTFHNQAGLARMNNLSAGVFYESRFMVDELSLASATAVMPVKTGTFGLSFYQFGKGSFKENKIGLAFAKQLSKKLKAGIQLDYLSQRFPENERSKGTATFEAGVIFQPIEQLFLGAHVFNPVLSKIKSPSGILEVPLIVRFGGHYTFNKSALFTFEGLTRSGSRILWKSGIEFFPVKNLALRIGFSGRPVKFTSGIGYSFGKISTDIGFSYHGNLGVTPSVSLQFEL